MSDLKLDFTAFGASERGILLIFCDETGKFGAQTRKTLGDSAAFAERAITTERFKGKLGSVLELIAPPGLRASRLVLLGCGKPKDLKARDYARLGGIAMGKIPSTASEGMIVAELPTGAVKPKMPPK